MLLGVFSGIAAAGEPADIVQPNTVWKDEKRTLTILERRGDVYRARFTSQSGFIREASGAVKGNTLSWLAKDVKALKGNPGGDNFGTISGERIDFTYREANGGKILGTFTLFRAGGPGPVAAPPAVADSRPASLPTAALTDPNQPRVEVLKEQAPNATEWALAPLDQAVPADIRQNLTFLREDLLDEGKQHPKASADAYALGSQICQALLTVFEERNQALVRAGFRAVEAQTRTGVSSQALDARRNYKMSWPQFAREESQRAELKSQAVNGAAVLAERPKVEWATRTSALRLQLDQLYAKYRDALRQSAK